MESIITEADRNGIFTIIAISVVAMVILLVFAKAVSPEVTKRSLFFAAGLCGGVAIGLYSLWPLFL